MEAVLQVMTGSSAGKRIVLQAGESVSVGRLEQARLVIRDDPLLSNVHFVVDWDGTTCRLRDANSRFGTRLNGQPITEANVTDEGVIGAGQTTFRLRLGEASPSGTPSGLAPSAHTPDRLRTEAATRAAPTAPTDLLTFFRTLPEPLFGLLDAARDPQVLAVLRDSDAEYASLYEGAKGDELAEFAPYLVRLTGSSPLLKTLVAEAWGKSWGVYLTCGRPFDEVRKHFRRFLLVKTEAGEDLYFRFYDPRVLRVFLPTCMPAQTTEFFGPVGNYLMEGAEPQTLLQFTDSRSGPRQHALAVSRQEALTTP